MKTRLALAAILALALSAPAAARRRAPEPVPPPSVPAVLDAPLPNDPMGVTIQRLPNGLTVYLSPNKGRPRIAARIATRAGSKDDPAEATGQAHYLEHMLFKGTQKMGTLDYAGEAPHLARIQALYQARAKAKTDEARARIDKEIDAENVAASKYESPNEIDRFYSAIGADGVNAFTSNEETVFVEDIPSNRLEAWAAVESERFRDPVFRLFPTELEAVYEEKNRGMDNADRALDEEVEKRLYKAHPYGQQTTIGTIESLKNPSLAQMRAFYERWYVPNNMAIVLSGDFDPAEAMKVIREHFGDWTPKALPPAKTWPLPKPDGEEDYSLKFEAERKVVVAWPTAAAAAPDADALSVMDMILDNSASGLLNLRLNQAQLVKESGSYPRMMNDAGGEYLWAVPKEGQTLEQARDLLLKTVEELKAGDFDESDLKAVITNFEIDEKRRLEENDGRASAMVQSFVSDQPWERTVGRLDRLRAVTKDDVVRVARKYLGPDRIVVFRRQGRPDIPKIAKPGFTALTIDPSRESPFLKEALSIPAAPIEPRWLTNGKDYQIVPVSGGRLYATKNPYDDLFQLTIRFDRGWRSDRRLCTALDLLDLSGAGPYSADEFKKKLYALGTSLWYSCDEQESAVTISGIDRNFWPSLELMQQRFDWPRVSSGTLSKMVDVELGRRQDEKKDPGAVFYALGRMALRGRESEVLGRLTDAELKSLTEPALIAVIRDFPRWRRRIGYVGPRSPSEVAKLLESWARFKPVPARVPLRYLAPQKTRVLFSNRDMVQARVGLSAQDEVYDPAHALDYLFYSEYMDGGMGSVIFQEVREARSLAYSAGGGHTLGAHKGDETRLWGQLGCQADKTPEAAELMMRLLREPPMSDQRFRDAERALEQTYRTDPVTFRRIPQTVMRWEDEGLAGDPGPERFARLKTYAPADLQSYVKKFKDEPMTVWILGQRGRVGEDKLKTLGDFEEKGLDALFPY
jgi:predicted Zn-dependent peptidase